MAGTCFVVMGYGKKTDFESGRTLDLDRSYRNLIKPAVEAAGLTCVRADEIVHSGLIDVPMYQQLLDAEVVVADLSTSNKNAFYELGIRHALRLYSTIVIAEEGLKAPFDVNHVVIRSYRHLGEDIGFDEVVRFRQVLTDAITKIRAQQAADRVDSPVYRFVSGLTPPARAATPPAGAPAPAVAAAPAGSPSLSPDTHSALMQQVDLAQQQGDFLKAKALLSTVRDLRRAESQARNPGLPVPPDDPYVVQRLALVTYKSKHPSEEAALRDARELLVPLAPATSNDTETLGLWGAVHKRLHELTRDTADLDEAVRAYERGFYLRNDYYNGINLAFLLNRRVSQAADPAEAVADFVLARRVRREVLAICDAWLAANPEPAGATATDEAAREYRKQRYWVLATRGEALLGLGDAGAPEQLTTAYAAAPEGWMKQSTEGQIAKLEPLLAASPLGWVKAAPGDG